MPFFLPAMLLLICCNVQPKKESKPSLRPTDATVSNTFFDSSFKSIHVFVALCDNKYQGIVPVPAKIGNGQDPDNNLYWGCAFGVRSYFSNSSEWTLLRKQKIDSIKMERLIFKHKTQRYYLLADAYNGRYIKQTMADFLQSGSGKLKDTLKINNTTIGIYGNSTMLAFIGHDGLMDFQLNEKFQNTDGKIRDVIILACISKKYFAPHLKATLAQPLVWSTGLMSPEAYTLHDAIKCYIKNGSPELIRNAAADAYAKYQHCSKKAALGLLVAGW